MGKKRPKSQKELEELYEKLRKRNKMSKQESKEVIQMLGGKQALRDYADGLDMYVESFCTFIIVQGLRPDETDVCEFIIRKMAEDMRKGKTWMFSYEGVSRVYERRLMKED